MPKLELKWNKDLYKNRKELIPIILEKDKELYDYNTNGEDGGKYSYKKAKAMWMELNNLYKEINKANNIYYHESKWIDEYCRDTFNTSSGLTGEKLIDYVANTLNKVDGIVVKFNEDKESYTYRDSKYRNNMHYYLVYVITANKTYIYRIDRGYSGTFNLKPVSQNWTNNKFVYKHPCELLQDGINYTEDTYKGFLDK